MNFIISPLQAASDQAVVKPKEDVAHYLQQIGLQPLWYNRFIKFEGDGDWAGRIEGMLGPVQAGDVVIYQTPTYADITIEKYIIEAVHQRHAKIVALVHDVEYLRYPELYPKVEWLAYLNSFDVVMVSTVPMAAAIKADGVKRPMGVRGADDVPPTKLQPDLALCWQSDEVEEWLPAACACQPGCPGLWLGEWSNEFKLSAWPWGHLPRHHVASAVRLNADARLWLDLG